MSVLKQIPPLFSVIDKLMSNYLNSRIYYDPYKSIGFMN